MIGRREEEENCLQKINGKTVRVHALFFWEGLVLKVRELNRLNSYLDFLIWSSTKTKLI